MQDGGTEIVMSSYIITPGAKTEGKVKISGSKNAALPIIAASLLSDEKIILHNIPNLSDVQNMCTLIAALGAKYSFEASDTLTIEPQTSASKSGRLDNATKLRASFLIIGPSLAKYGKIKIPMPGGCAIGARPIDLHLKGFKAMGAKIKQGHGYVELKCERLDAAKIYLDFPSVGATENIMTAACLANGQTIIENAATEPEISDLADFLCAMGADICGAGGENIIINGVKKLHSVEYTIIPDRIEAGTFLLAAAAGRCRLCLENVICDHLKPIIAKLNEMGFVINESLQYDSFKKREKHKYDTLEILPCEKFRSVDIKTLPYPGFPTDMQAQFMSLMSIADGTGVVIETVFENRFMQVPELLRMGAKIKTDGRTAVIDGTKRLSGAKVKATDLRAGAALVIAAIAAQGETEICNIDHIERGYENFDRKMLSVGVNIKKISSEL